MSQMRFYQRHSSELRTRDRFLPKRQIAWDLYGDVPGLRESRRALFLAMKRIFDFVISLLLLPVLLALALILLSVNPWLNPGPLFFVQVRMGRARRAFPLIKFRSMQPAQSRRGADDPVELDRVTLLGRFLRESRIDELPQILNVLRGDMSLIGPRPDMFSHARAYCRQVPGYRERHALRPGISGLAQVQQGYAEGVDATHEKARLDLLYIEKLGLRQECFIFVQTLRTILASVGK